MQYIPSFWCNNILLKRDFKNIKIYQNILRQQAVSSLYSYLEKFKQTDLTDNLIYQIYAQFLVRFSLV